MRALSVTAHIVTWSLDFAASTRGGWHTSRCVVALAPTSRHPLERAFGPSLGAVFRVSLVLSLVVMAALATLDAGLRGPSAPLGIVSFEIAGSGAQALLDGWTEAQRRDAMLVQGLDYFFLVVYSTALASAALLIGRRLRATHPRLAALAGPAAWAHTLAGAADAIENTPMTLALRSGVADPTGATVSLAFACGKGVLLVLGIAYVLVALAALATPAARRGEAAPDASRGAP